MSSAPLSSVSVSNNNNNKKPTNWWGRQNATPLKFDPKLLEAAFSKYFL